ncbi:MAG: hypothetical protein Q9223_007100 [Gallowayella weberi]
MNEKNSPPAFQSPTSHFRTPFSQSQGCRGRPTITGTIPPSTSVPIPLRNLKRTSSRHSPDEHSTSLLQESNEKAGRHSDDSAGSEFSLWSDTGDLAEQLADEEDPLQIKLRESFDGEVLGRFPSKSQAATPKHVHYHPQDHQSRKGAHPGINKEAIQIPEPPPRQIGRVEYLLAIIMTGNRSTSQSHGLTGKPLL